MVVLHFIPRPEETVEKVVFGVQKLAFAIFCNFDVLICQLLTFLEKLHQQAGALRLEVFQHALKVVAINCNNYHTLNLCYSPLGNSKPGLRYPKKTNVEAQIAYLEKGINFFKTKKSSSCQKMSKRVVFLCGSFFCVLL
jgi:hypothetical protein